MNNFGRNRLYKRKTSATRRRSSNVPVFCCLKLVVHTTTWSNFLAAGFCANFFAALRTLVVTGRDGFPRAINQKIIACA